MGQITYFDQTSGTNKRLTIYGKTRDEVRDKMLVAQYNNTTGKLTAPTKTTVEDWMTTWLNDYMASTTKPTTFSLYKTIIEAYIVPHLGPVQLSKLQTSDLQRFYKLLLEQGRRKKPAEDKKGKPKKEKKALPPGLAPKTVHRIHQVLYSALKQAVLEHKIPYNPCENAKPPKPETKPIQPLTAAEVKKFLNFIRFDWFYPVFLTELGTGLRRGELLGLKWGDIDLEAATVQIRRSLVVVDGHALLQDDVKTKSSRASITIPDEVVRILTKYKERLTDELRGLDHELDNDDLVFTWKDGRPVNPNHIRRHFSNLLEKAGLPHIRFHDLRHTYATLLLEAGEHPKVVQEMLRHKQISTTLDIYSHVVPGMKIKAASTINGILTGEPKKKRKAVK